MRDGLEKRERENRDQAPRNFVGSTEALTIYDGKSRRWYEVRAEGTCSGAGSGYPRTPGKNSVAASPHAVILCSYKDMTRHLALEL